MLICQGAGIACPGLWPLIFPNNGYHGQLSWLESTAAIGPSALKSLLEIVKEGKICLPKFISIKLLTGQVIQLGPSILFPGQSWLSRHPSVSFVARGKETVVDHEQLSVKNSSLGELNDPDEGVHLDCDVENVIRKEKEEETFKSSVAARTVTVEGGARLSQEQLEQHFSEYGELESVKMLSGNAVVTFSTFGVVEHLAPQEHILPEGQVRLRLQGGHGSRPPPPRQQQQSLNPFR